ncbi:ABC transporter permease [Nakamurella silvestris]|nr:ABC transporter permease [Nakamurella silvestris]
MTMTVNYTLLSARTTFANARFVIFTVALPLVMFLLFSSLYGDQGSEGGISVTAYLMVSMACYGGIGAAINSGARVAVERQTGWNRQLRLTALSPTSYLVAKAAVSMLVALPAIILVFLAGAITRGVELPATTWLLTGLAVWLGLIPFAVLGLVIGSLGTVDAVQPITMLVFIGMSILGGLWFPVSQFSPFLHGVAKVLPSYWIGEVGREVLAGSGVPPAAVAVLLAWTIGLGVVGAATYRRSGARR